MKKAFITLNDGTKETISCINKREGYDADHKKCFWFDLKNGQTRKFLDKDIKFMRLQ